MDYEEFFGFKQSATKDEKKERAAEVLQEKKEEVKRMAPHEKKEMIDYLEELDILPAQRNNPNWKAKSRSEADQSLLSILKKMGAI